MKLTKSQLRRIIREEMTESLDLSPGHADDYGFEKQIREAVIAISGHSPGTAKKAMTTHSKWHAAKDKSFKGDREKDPKVQDLLRTFWDSTGDSPGEQAWATEQGLTSGSPATGDASSKAWSAAFVSYAEDDPQFTDSIRHRTYMKDAEANRKIFDSGDSTDNKFVAFRKGEYVPGPGDKRCYKRKGGYHCDICLDTDCKTVVGGNVGDDLTKRPSPKDFKMYITKSPKHVEKKMAEQDERLEIVKLVKEIVGVITEQEGETIPAQHLIFVGKPAEMIPDLPNMWYVSGRVTSVTGGTVLDAADVRDGSNAKDAIKKIQPWIDEMKSKHKHAKVKMEGGAL